MKVAYASEAALCEAAGSAARAWRSLETRLVIGLEGDLGAGKTTWVRAMLAGLGFTGRVPSPTFTLLEHYELGELTVVHLDLYRIAEAGELEFLGLRDWLELPQVWLVVEWPMRAGKLLEALDLQIAFSIQADEGRELDFDARSPAGRAALTAWLG